MRQERFYEPHKQGLERLTGDNSGLVYCNERIGEEEDPETGTLRRVYTYDVYTVSDARDPHKVKDEVIRSQYPDGGELKILRKTLARLLQHTGMYEHQDYGEFRSYNEFVEAIE